MQTPDDSFGRLRAALDELVRADAADLLAQARADARERVRGMLGDALAQSMLEHIREQLVPAAPADLPEQRAPRTPEQPARDEGAAAQTPDETGWYVYGVVGEVGEPPGRGVAGIDPSSSVTLIREGPLAAVASAVPLSDFGEAQLRTHLADMDWVERIARAHEQALEQIQSEATVIPMRMCTVYRTEDGVREMLRREAEALQTALAHLEGRSEWGVKVFAARRRLAPSTPVDTSDAPGAGAAYMDRKSREREEAEHAAQLIEEAAARIHERLCAVAADGLVSPPQRPEVSGHDGEMILNGVYLVDDHARDSLHDEVQALREEFRALGLELVPTGPWPAYNFVPGTIGAAW